MPKRKPETKRARLTREWRALQVVPGPEVEARATVPIVHLGMGGRENRTGRCSAAMLRWMLGGERYTVWHPVNGYADLAGEDVQGLRRDISAARGRGNSQELRLADAQREILGLPWVKSKDWENDHLEGPLDDGTEDLELIPHSVNVERLYQASQRRFSCINVRSEIEAELLLRASIAEGFYAKRQDWTVRQPGKRTLKCSDGRVQIVPKSPRGERCIKVEAAMGTRLRWRLAVYRLGLPFTDEAVESFREYLRTGKVST